MTTSDVSPRYYREEIAKMKEHIKRQDQIIEDMNKKECYVNNGLEEVKDFFIPPFVFIPINILLRFVSSVGKPPTK